MHVQFWNFEISQKGLYGLEILETTFYKCKCLYNAHVNKHLDGILLPCNHLFLLKLQEINNEGLP